ncbi:FAD-dependent monooxygenase [Streptomyces sp. NPDC058257]|uniref:FAD-dependent monooxygenase n=1 Tax=Streptomyces sp. NPDC058257 TaxID=3346409 RepID=UPI0036ED9F87
MPTAEPRTCGVRPLVQSGNHSLARRRHEVVGVIQDHEGVSARVRCADGPRRVTARYLVGCDGRAQPCARHGAHPVSGDQPSDALAPPLRGALTAWCGDPREPGDPRENEGPARERGTGPPTDRHRPTTDRPRPTHRWPTDDPYLMRNPPPHPPQFPTRKSHQHACYNRPHAVRRLAPRPCRPARPPRPGGAPGRP